MERKALLKKQKEVDHLSELVKQHSVVGVLNMHKLPARQLQKIRGSLRGSAVIKMNKKSVILRALEKTGLGQLKEKIHEEPALILTNENPFRLYKILKESRSPAPAKAGDIAQNDIVVQKGPTPVPPGPAISSFQKIGLKTSVQGGKIAIAQDKVVAKAGEAINEDTVNVLNMLKMEPMEIGLELVCALEEGTVYGKDVLDIDQAWYFSELQFGVQRAFNLSVNTGYPTKLTIETILTKAYNEARTLAWEQNIPEKEFIDDVLIKATREAKALGDRIGG